MGAVVLETSSILVAPFYFYLKERIVMDFFNESFMEINFSHPVIFTPYFSTKAIQNATTNLRLYCNNYSPSILFLNWQTQLGLLPLLMQHSEIEMKLHFEKLQYSSTQLQEFSEEQIIKDILPNSDLQRASKRVPTISFIYLPRSSTIFSILDKHPLNEQRHLSLGLQLHKNNKIRVYKNEIRNMYTIITNTYNWQLLRRVIALLPMLFPDTFKPSETELSIMKLFGRENYIAWETELLQWLKDSKVLENDLKEKLFELADNIKEHQLSNLISLKTRIQEGINMQLNSLQVRYADLENVNTKIRYQTLTQDDSNIKDFTNYLMKNKYITNLNLLNRTSLKFNIFAPIKYYDIEALQVYYKKDYSPITKHPNIAKLFKLIFMEQKYSIYFDIPIMMDLMNIHWGVYLSARLQNQIPHPHIVTYNCWGTNKTFIDKAISTQDFITAVEQMVAAAKNINFTDTVVLDSFIRDLLVKNNYYKAIQKTEDKKFYTYNEIKESGELETD